MSSTQHDFTSFAVIPAAGKSLRMGRPKLLLPWGNTTVIEAVLNSWISSTVDHVVVVVDEEDHVLANTLARCACTLVRANAPPDMKASVQSALREIDRRWSPQDRDVWLLAPGDFPTLSPVWIDALLSKHDHSEPSPLVPTFQGRRGHPVLFPWPLAAAACSLPADTGMNRLLSENPPHELAMSDDGLLAEMNTPEEYEKLREQFRPK